MVFHYQKRTKTAGFTLIEILVVVSIIGLLSVVIMSSLSTARELGRDAKRIEDANSLMLALEVYYRKYGHYPISADCSGGTGRPNSSWCNTFQTLSNDGHWIRHNDTNNALDNIDALEEFFGADPIDPLSNRVTSVSSLWDGTPTVPPSSGTYYYFSDGFGGPGQWFMIVFVLENGENNPITKNDGITTCDGTNINYGQANSNENIVTLGGECKL